MSRALLYLNTLRYLKPAQLLHRALPRNPRRVLPPAVRPRERTGPWTPAVQFEPTPLVRPTRLRDYTLHYHRNPTAALIEAWIRDNPPGRGAGWEPYPLSLRIANWIKWMLASRQAPAEVVESLATQAEHLRRTVEYHLLANHLFANAKALAFAGAYLTHEPWLRTGRQLLEQELKEQILEDGGHYERTPLYHSLILEDVLDLINLGYAYPGLLPDWSVVAEKMLNWLQQMTHPDGGISFFNDATFGVAPEPDALVRYAKRLGIRPAQAHLGDSGYIRLQRNGTVLLFDAGAVGPDYQPGHAHADTLSFELSRGSSRLLVNSGISTYECGTERLWQRGTAAHNTVRIDGTDQSEVWSAFRVARRARPFARQTDHFSFAEAAHDGYQRLQRSVTHFRRIDLNKNGAVVQDRLEGAGTHLVEMYYHLYPEADVAVEIDGRMNRSVEQTFYHPGFECAVPNCTIVGRYRGELGLLFTTRITWGLSSA